MLPPAVKRARAAFRTPELDALLEFSRVLGGTAQIRSSLDAALAASSDTPGSRSLRAVRRRASGDLGGRRQASQARRTAARLRPGEAVTGRVDGRPVVLPQVSKAPLLRSSREPCPAAAAAKGVLRIVSEPVILDRRAVGVLSVAFLYDAARDLARAASFLGVVASLLGQTLRADRLVEADKKRLLDENTKLKRELKGRYELKNIVGHSRPMDELYEKVAQAAPTATTVLIRGESGTGKELVAHALHYNSPRSARPFVRVSCAALPEALIESELFGYEPGAFTDARAQKKGRFELADGGTLFLDEVGDLSPATQIKILRVLQEREFERLGGVAPIKVDVRLVAATNRDLEAAMTKGGFREDLFYRLNVFTIFVPPLRDRREDIPLLADHFVEKYDSRHRKDVRRVSTGAIDVLMSYHWPGVRELENAIERAVLVCDSGVLHAHHLRPRSDGRVSAPCAAVARARGRLREGPPPRRAQDRARQPCEGRPAPRDDRAHLRIPPPPPRHREEDKRVGFLRR